MNKNVININDGTTHTDPRYGQVVALDVPGSAPLHKIDMAYARVNPGATSPAHYHERTEEVYAITTGDGTIIIDGVTTAVVAGDLIRIPTRTVHSITAGKAGVEFWVGTTPPYCTDDDFETDAASVEKPASGATAGQLAPTIAVIIGTHRKGSVSAKIARQIVGMYGELGVTTDLIDPAELPLTLFHPDSYLDRYDPNRPLPQRLVAAAGLHILCPEYNGGFSGVLKHLLDVVPYKQCFDGKPVAFIGVAAGEWGGLRAVDQLQQIFAYRNAHTYGKRVFIKEVDEAPADGNGYLTDPQIVNRLRTQVSGFADFVRALST